MTDMLRIFGRLGPDNRLTLRPGYTNGRVRDVRSSGDDRVVAEVVDERGAVVVRSALRVKRYSEGRSLAVRGTVALPEGATSVVVLRLDESGRDPIVLATIDVPATRPDVRWRAVPTHTAEGQQPIAWTAQGDPRPVEAIVDYSHNGGETWIPVSRRTTDEEVVVDFDELPGGDRCVVAVSVTNGVRSSTVVSEPFRVALKPCRALIQRPVDSEQVGSNVLLVGNGWWLERAHPETEQLWWTSDVDGQLGQGRAVRVRLSPGHHTLTLTAGMEDRAGSESISVDVVEQ